jgi:NAD(P)H dehydrogenase (quinone)
MSTGLIGITGATGHVGGGVVRHLQGDGLPLRLLVRDPARAPQVPGAEVARLSYGDPAAVEALAGVETLFMVSAAEDAERVAQHRGLVEAAAEAGVRHVVYTSFVGAGETAGFLLGRDHGATEDIIRSTGLAHTFLRDNFYVEVWADFGGTESVIRGPAGDGRMAAVSRRDVAAVAAHVLRDPGAHAGATYDLTGPEALTLTEVAEVLTRVTGRPHTFVDETMEEARASRSSYGAPDWLVDAWISTYTAIRDGELEHVSNDVPRLLGRPALGFAEAIDPTRNAS